MSFLLRIFHDSSKIYVVFNNIDIYLLIFQEKGENNLIYVLFAVFMGFAGSVIFKDGLFANALSTTVVFLLLIPIIFAVGGELYKQKEEEQKRQAEFERKQRVKRGHLEDDLTPQQRILWNSLHMSKRGSPYLRHAIWLAASSAVLHDPALKLYFQKKRDEGKPYMASVGHACRKIVSIIYAVMRDNKAYTPCIPNEISA